MMELTKPSVIKDIMNRYGFRFSKSLGQNFLIEPAVLEKIIAGAEVGSDDCVLEIGPGFGTLTQYLAQVAKCVTAVEIDRTLLPVLAETLAEYSNVDVVHGDALKVDLKQIIEQKFSGQPPKVIANLPYYVTTPIIMRFLEEAVPITDLVVMVQREVAERIASGPGTKEYGSLSVAVQYFCEPKVLFRVPTGCFMPPPKVESAVIRLKMLAEPRVKVENRDIFFATVQAAFGKRRKTLLNALSDSKLHLDKIQVAEALESSGIDAIRRAETLTIEEFAQLSNAVWKAKKKLK